MNQQQSMRRNSAPREPGTQLALRSSVLALPTEQWNRLDMIAERAFRSGTLPKAVDSREKAFIIALKGHALGLDPLYAMEHMAVINGKATIDGQVMLALIYRAREIEVFFPPTANPAESCRVKMRRKGAELEVTWTIERAKRAGLLNNPSWLKYPDQMLRWRAISECARVIAPDVIGGLYLHEELGATVNEGGEVIEAEFTTNPAPNAPAGPEANVLSASAAVAPAENTSSASAEPAAGSAGVADSPAETRPTEKQLRRLFAIKNSANWSDGALKTFMRARYGKESTKELTWTQYEETCKEMEANPLTGDEPSGSASV